MSKLDKKILGEIRYAEKSEVPITNMAYKDSPPPFISVIGPRNSGKTTLIKSIFEYFWKKDIKIDGPVTMKIRNKRFTYHESGSDINSIIDAIKISDMLILVINSRIGLEKETLETLNIMNSQGAAKLCFVMTNTNRKSTKEIEKRIEKEFSYPVRFFNMDLDKDSKYYGKIGSLVRYLDVMKFRPIEWKCTHPHIVVDKIKDGQFYGYVRGGPLTKSFNAHVPGHGDINVIDMDVAEDPCDLKSRFNILYNPSDMDADNNNVGEVANDMFLEDDEVRLFNSSENEMFEHSETLPVHNQIDPIISEVSNETEESLESIHDDIDDLKSILRKKFVKAEPQINNDSVEGNILSEDTEPDKKLNFLQIQKQEHLNLKNKLEENTDLIVPGKYVRLSLKADIKTKLIIIGSYLSSEGNPGYLKGQIRKSKYLKFDLKSNSSFFISMGWFRFQTIPVFFQNNKFMKYCKVSSDILFYAPSITVGTSFFIYNTDSEYRFFGSGLILDTSGDFDIKKKLKLIGYPKQITGNSAIIHSMFTTFHEVSKFLNAKLSTVSGLRGLIKAPIGKTGNFRATFEGSILQSEIIFLKCFVSVEPYMYMKHVVENERYIRELKTIRSECGKTNEVSDNTESESIEMVPDQARIARTKKLQSEIKKLERELPFGQRAIKEVKQILDLPIPPEQRTQHMRREVFEKDRALRLAQEEKLNLEKVNKKKSKQIAEFKLKQERKRKMAVSGFMEKRRHKKHKK